MAISTWKAGLDDIAAAIRTERQAFENAKARISTAYSNLVALPTDHADVIAEIQALGTDAAEEVAKAEYELLVTEFIDLRDEIDAARGALS
jgi:hypothetical protein